MFTIIKTIRKIVAALFLSLGIVVVATGVYCHHYQDQIIQKFLDEASKRSSNSIRMGSIQLTVLKSFPNIALILHDVVIKDCTETAADLVTARKICLFLDVWKLVQGQSVVAHLSLAHGKLHLGEDLGLQLGWGRGAQKTTQNRVPWIVQLQKITLKDMEIVYGSKKQRYSVSVEKMQASLRWENPRLKADLQGKATIQSIQLQDLSFARNLPISLKAALSYDQRQKTWTLQSAQLQHGNSLLAVQGSGSLETTSSIALTIQGKKISPQILLRCLPKQYYQKIKPYDPHGELTFNLSVNEQQRNSLALQGDFVLRDGALTASQFSTPVELSQLSGHLNIPNLQNLKTATLSIDKIISRLASSRLEGRLSLNDFHKLHLQCAAEATLDLASLSMLLAYPAITDASGRLDLHWELEANLQQLMRGTHARDNLHLSGALQTQAAQFKLGQSQLPCEEMMGKLVFQDNALIIKDFSGSIGPGSFILTGTVHNLFPYLLSGNQNICVVAKLYMDYLDLDALFYGKRVSTSPTSTTSAKFDIAPRWTLNLDCDIQQLHCRRFRGKNVRGEVRVKDQKLIAEKLQLGVSGGKVFLDGVLDASTDDLNIHTVAKLQGVRIADLFYTFENFHQHFLMDSHLGGEVFSDIDLTMQADKQWNMRWDVLQAAIDVRLSNGVLHDFAPIRQLAKYVDKEDLANLRFSELKNHILIEDQTIYLPPMEVHSDLTHIQLSGTHTFDGRIAYQFGVPFMGLQQQGRARASTAVSADAPADMNLFFKLQGDINNYKISYDAEASRKSLTKAFKEQGKTLKALLQGVYQEEKHLQELAPDDYFEFDE
ncbi:MAG: hypothetical protein RL012_360 [Bacteroidota bacterium]|jgi:hypothetical protein